MTSNDLFRPGNLTVSHILELYCSILQINRNILVIANACISSNTQVDLQRSIIP